MMYKLYIKDDCQSCREVLQEVETEQSELRVINIDHDSEQPPNNVPIVPALFRERQLLAYGKDILNYI